jgi:uncharacterized membrane protein
MLATIAWIGGLAAVVLVLLPAAHRTLEAEAFAALLEKIQRRLDPLGWLSLTVLLGTGLFQMSANPNYQGFLTIANLWAAAILVKHLVFIGMIGVSAYITWGLLPAQRRVALLRARRKMARGAEDLQGEALQRREVRLLRLNLILGVIVLGLTALARAS